MPIEIRELTIRVSVSQNQTEQEGGSPSAAAAAGPVDREDLIAECVERVMELLRLRNER